jgi:hypothetical protein
VLDVVEGIADETVIELAKEEKGIIERYGSTRKYIRKKESETCDTLGYSMC